MSSKSSKSRRTQTQYRNYKVQPGDNPTKIAKELGVSIPEVLAWSGITDPRKLRIGQLIPLKNKPYPGKLNNPGNIRKPGKQVYPGGYINPTNSKDFLSFYTPTEGLNGAAIAAAIHIRNQLKNKGTATVQGVANGYAPANENNTSVYAKNIMKAAGIDTNKSLISLDKNEQKKYLKALVRYETSKEASEWFNDNEYTDAIRYLPRNQWGGTIPDKENRPLYFDKDKDGKITGYGTTRSMVIEGAGDNEGKFLVVPTIVDGKLLSDAGAIKRYEDTNEYWAGFDTIEQAANFSANVLHKAEEKKYSPVWNKYLEEHPDELSPQLIKEIEKAKKAEEKPNNTIDPTQGDVKGGDVEDDQVTEIEESVSESEDSDTDVTEGGPRIVINPTTFKNQKDALCVAFNERFRIWMEQHGFEPTSEPTDKQRKFFSDTAYADDETQLRRTILARIATLDTSIEDPTDDQILETLSMLKDFQKTEQAENEWESTALDRLIKLVLAAAPIAEPKLVDGDVPSVRMEQVEEAPI